ncbi:MAG TPA: fumarylacetoacetate hydrolase family protein [Nitrososphaerales archaeon]|nr:fumarylacetoacetate hydrolase family protein [Nitrososphaerales archaeon]
MKLVTFVEPYYHQERIGIFETGKGGSYVMDANHAFSLLLTQRGEAYPQSIADQFIPPDMVQLLRLGKASMTALRETEKFALNKGPDLLESMDGGKVVFSSDKVKFKAPVPRPGKIVHTAGNFREHAKEGKTSGWEFPIPQWISFLKSPSAIVGHEDNIIRPRYTKKLDHEIELAIIIGKKSKHLSSRKSAWDAVAGFTVFNDITARDIQSEEMKNGLLNFGKNMDTFAPFGPCFVPKDDIGDVHNLRIECRVNGQKRQISNTNRMSVSVPEIVQHYSWVTLYPGDILTTGTVSGVAAFRKNPEKYYLKPGDILESEIENIGILRNRIVEDKEVY